MIRRFLPVLVLSLLACDRSPRVQVFAPREAGLTLGYEDPSLEPGPRTAARRMVRVAKVSPHPEGGALVLLTTASLREQTSATLWLKGSGVVRLTDQGRTQERLLPEGFPDATPSWTDHGFRYTVVGRAMATGLAVELPRDFDRMGVWVERTPEQGGAPRQRTFHLPELGPVETLEWRAGAWVPVDRLVQRGFTDSPR